MPVYSIDKTFTAGTAKSTAETQTLEVASGTIKQLRLLFPSGCANLVHVRVFYRGRQILPSNTDKEFIGDDVNINIPLHEEIPDEPAQLVISGWNTDTFDHQITGEVVILSKKRGA